MSGGAAGGRARELQTLSAFARALVHRLRTPLSVISNDLQYLRSLIPADEPFAAPERCRQVSDLLGDALALLERPPVLTTLPLRRLVTGLGLAEAPARSIRGDEVLLPRAFRLTREMLGRIGGEEASPVEVTLSVAGESVAVRFTARLPALLAPLRVGHLSSLTELCCHMLDLDSYEAPAIDAVIGACGGAMRVDVAERVIEAEIAFPLEHHGETAAR